MAYNNSNRGSRISTDRFGRPYQLKTAMEVVAKDGTVIQNHFKAHVELGGKLYEIYISPREKETKSGGNACWVKVTKKDKQQRQSSM